MCTVSWLRDSDGGYQLFCNRDEKRTRKAAVAPLLQTAGGTRFIAPLDGECGGTWIGVNEHGVSVCLLNRYDRAARGLVSRGLLVLDLLGSRSAAEAVQSAVERDLGEFSPFTLAVLEPASPTALCVWDGAVAQIFPDADALIPLVSSSRDQKGAEKARKTAFQQAESLEHFHRTHMDSLNAYSPCMHREDAETVSFSRVTVSASEISLSYSPAPPCRRVPPVVQKIPR
jgi:transport and Golgi organization protein 2